MLDGFLKSIGVNNTYAGVSLYVKHENGDVIIIVVYVNGLMLSGSSVQKMKHV